MPESKLLFDTNAVIDWLQASNGNIQAAIQENRLAISLITLGELEFGARNSQRQADNLAAIEGLLSDFDLILPDRATASIYGSINADLRQRGKPIPTNDIWIAALARQHALPLLTMDSHFEEIEGLEIRRW